ncbi:MAG: ATP-dependent DNA helicase RecG [Campylobacteraceae bacterium]|jgi:ATP-dependent DNA helicase RecG|nr:ATP-dependent DNA helicase RecG [Campylobacteraceae bacterium]
MTLPPKDKNYFEKIGVSSCIELALLVPTKYDDLTISHFPKFDELNVVEITIIKLQRTPKFLRAAAFAWNEEAELIIFNPKNFHYLAFKAGNRFFVRTLVQKNFGKLQLIQPKIISEIGRILPVYKTELASKTVRRLINEYLKETSLIEEGLPAPLAKNLITLHNPISGQSYEKSLKDALYALKFAEIYLFLKALGKKKQYFKATDILQGDEKEFIKSLPFTLTNDQIKAIADIKSDLSKPVAARRVIIGDVGSGKTVVIFAAVMMAYPKKSILMAPTTILSAQIYNEAKRLLPSFVNIALAESGKINEELNKADFIIGTHVLLYRELPQCSLVMIDEQHRFGTAQRDAIHKIVSEGTSHPHFLQFSATPIPRTMTLIHSSLVNYSFIKEMPFKKEIDTLIIDKKGFGRMLFHIENEINEGRQAAVIYPLVEESEALVYQSIDEGRAFWESRYKGVFVTHGKDKNKEQILEEFAKNGSILLATTVVEVGISLPKLSTIVIVGAERLGLSTLHQLRGRVSRTGLKGCCYLYTNCPDNERLKEFSKTVSGFDIAELDLKYRQSGDVLGGVLQHGVQFKWFSLGLDADILQKAQYHIAAFSHK